MSHEVNVLEIDWLFTPFTLFPRRCTPRKTLVIGDHRLKIGIDFFHFFKIAYNFALFGYVWFLDAKVWSIFMVMTNVFLLLSIEPEDLFTVLVMMPVVIGNLLSTMLTTMLSTMLPTMLLVMIFIMVIFK